MLFFAMNFMMVVIKVIVYRDGDSALIRIDHQTKVCKLKIKKIIRISEL